MSVRHSSAHHRAAASPQRPETPGKRRAASAEAGPAEVFDPVENLRQNQEWYARQQALKEHKRAVHNAACDLQHMSAHQQWDWVQRHGPHLPRALFERLHPRVQIAIIEAEEAAVEREEAALEKAERQQAVRQSRPAVRAFLLAALAGGRRVPAREVLERAEAAGISLRTLYRVKAQLRVRSERIGFGPDGYFVWHLPATFSRKNA